jgi:hypothetical protein
MASTEIFCPPEVLAPLWKKPPFPELLACLHSLHVEPPIWNLDTPREVILKEEAVAARHAQVDTREVTQYLNSIIRSPLSWLDDDDQRDEIWSEASKRTAERCGRAGMSRHLQLPPIHALRYQKKKKKKKKRKQPHHVTNATALAMGEILRRWPLSSSGYTPFDLTIREPPITGDSLGFKTWGSSYVLARLLPQFAADSLAHLFASADGPALTPVLEIGSGTGLLGLAAACIWRTSVVLTDLPEIVSNLQHNLELNQTVVKQRGGSVDSAVLVWGGADDESDARFGQKNKFKVYTSMPTPSLIASCLLLGKI